MISLLDYQGTLYCMYCIKSTKAQLPASIALIFSRNKTIEAGSLLSFC
ncbi:hypothetical protein HBA_0486 [Sodalis endosymbiont of Henestaris halophilus]|nr:hypothetical protein HBA_0486 [Sodalis endosymbiont of Henestaris halophilus]